MLRHASKYVLTKMLKIANLESTIPEVENPYSFPLDPFQKVAFDAINKHENVLVTAKTGSGKTLVGEYQIRVSIAKGKRVFYTTPIKSLTNQKFYDLKKSGVNTGIVTGDIRFRPDADVVIMTTEILCNMLYNRKTESENDGDTAGLTLDNVDALIFDEVHYINNMERGKVWEECLILLPKHINLVLLSATIDQPETFAKWLGDLKQRPVHLISTTYRIVPLVHWAGDECIMDAKDVFHADGYNRFIHAVEKRKKQYKEHRDHVADRRRGGYENDVIDKPDRNHSLIHRINELVRDLDMKEQLPALFFVFSRQKCAAYAMKIEDTLLDSSDIASVKHIVKFHLRNYPDVEKSPQYHMLTQRLEKGVAVHHSGLLPILREIVEFLFMRGFVKLLFATETFAVGLNMPTKTVVLTSFRKHDGVSLRMLKKDEYVQMAGRAGRRGKDDRGNVIYIPEREPESLEDVRSMMMSGQQKLESKMDFHYKFILRTIHGYKMDWKDIANASFWKIQNDAYVAGLVMNISQISSNITSLQLSPEDIEDMRVRDTIESNMKQTGNAERRIHQRSLEVWKNTHVGPKWETKWKSYTTWKHLTCELRSVEKIKKHAEDYTRDIENRVRYLDSNGFIGTTLGRLASNVHTGHSILMARAFHDKLFHDLDIPSLFGCLSLFLQGHKDSRLLNDGSHMTPAARTAAQRVFEIADVYRNSDTDDNESYWMLSSYWIDVAVRWGKGDDPFSICYDYSIYEGDFVKSMVKLSKLLEEWQCMCRIMGDTSQLETLKNAKSLLLRSIVSAESMYINL